MTTILKKRTEATSSNQPQMEAKKVKLLAAATVAGLLILLVILWSCLKLSKTFFLIASITLAVILAILLWVLIQYAELNWLTLPIVGRSAGRREVLRFEYSFLRRVAGLPLNFPVQVLDAATDHFQSVVGRGSSGTVFKGILDDGTSIAVKRIEGAENGDKEFKAEITAIASVQHVNLVRLLGYCLVPAGPRFIVYEFVPNGSLDNWIFHGDQQRCLPWALRYQVAIDVAKALAYLHHDCRSRVLHLDVKPENILLDECFRAFVSDFGLSKLIGKNESSVVTNVRGTRGYLAPEWLLERGVSEKSDIYSYGMVLLELVGGRRNVHLVGDGDDDDGSRRRWSYFPRIVAEKVRDGGIMEVVDERLVGEVDEMQVRALVYVALWCIQQEAKMRPSMTRVVDILEGRMGVDAPPEKEMVIVDLLSIEQLCDDTASEGQRPGSSAQSFGTSVLSGR